MTRRTVVFLSLLAVALVGPASGSAAPPAAVSAAAPPPAATAAAPDGTLVVAQNRRSFNLLDLLFGGARERRPSRDVGPPRETGPGEDRSWAVSQTPKDPDARRVHVIGDAFAAGLARGLEAAFADTPTVEIVTRVRADSGLVRDDHYDWQRVAGDLLATERVDIAVIMLGSNDRQPIRLADGTREPARSEKWDAAYIERVDALLDLFAERGVSVYWVGLPIMQPEGYAQDMAFLNEVFQARVQRAGGRFIDVWSRFADEEGRYSASGPDVSGQIRRLRNANGINLTRTGNEKLAFFVEQDLRTTLQEGGAFAGLPGLAGDGMPRRRPSGPVEMEVSLTRSDALPRAGRLAGGDEAPATAAAPVDESAPDYRLFVLGESPPPQKGRADDFGWPRAVAGTAAGAPPARP